MGDLSGAIKYLYQNFILRDVLSFVTPGAIVVFSVLLLYMEPPRLATLFQYSFAFHWLLYIPLFGLFYVIGFAVQCFGELTGVIRTHRLNNSCFCQRLKIFGCHWACKQAKQDKQDESNECDFPDFIWWKEAHKEMVKFNEETQDERKEWARLQHERLVVLKQMCANGFLALFIAAVVLAIHEFLPDFSHWRVFVVVGLTIVFLFSLLWGYRVHELRLDTMDRAIQGRL